MGRSFNAFIENDLRATLHAYERKVRSEIAALGNDQALIMSGDDLTGELIKEYTIEPLILHVDQIHRLGESATDFNVSGSFERGVPRGVRASVPGTKVEIGIPYEGDRDLWKFRPPAFSLSGYGRVELRGKTAVLTLKVANDDVDGDRLKQEIDTQVEGLRKAASSIASTVSAHNDKIHGLVAEAVARRRDQAERVKGAIEGLGIPLRRTSPAPAYEIPKRRRRPPSAPPAAQPAVPDPVLPDEEFDYILRVLRSMSLVMERCPRSVAHLDEEAIRDFFLIVLNGHYEGDATGETFNGAGKTDILLRVRNKNVFIAELKFWDGPKSFDAAITQLLRYLTWRDTKAALVIFNKNKDASRVLKKLDDVMRARQEFCRAVVVSEQENGRYVLRKQNEPGQSIVVAVQLYDIPSDDKEKDDG